MNLTLSFFGALALAGTYFGFKQKDPTIQLGSCFFERLAIPFYTFFNEFYSNGGLLVDYIGENYLQINTPLGKLYGIEIAGTSTIHNYLAEEKIKELIENFKRDDTAFFFYLIHKKGKWQKQYIISYNKTMLKSIGSYFAVDLMSGKELLEVLFDTYLENNYYIDNKRINRALNVSFKDNSIEPEFMSFKKITRQALHNSLLKTDVFQSYKNSSVSMTNIQSLFKLDFTGAIWFYFDISQASIERHISKIILETKISGSKEPFVFLKEKYAGNELDLVLVNATMYLRDYSAEVVGQIGSFLKTNFIQKEIGRSEHIKKTPLKYRDVDFDFIAEKDYIKNFIASIQKKNVVEPDFFGIDKSKGFISYSFAEENDNPHSVIIATPGSGKSVSRQKIIAQMIDLDFHTGFARKLGKGVGEVRLRSYDIGFSDDRLIKLLKTNPKNKVAHLSSSFYDFSYNIVSLALPKNNTQDEKENFEADKQFAIDLTSIILETQNGTALTVEERARYEEALNYIYSTRDYQRYRINDIADTHIETYHKLLNLGYKSSDYLDTIKEDEFEFLRKPLVRDVAKYANIQSSNKQRKEEETKAFNTLYAKLNTIDNISVFSTFDKNNITDVDVLAMDLNNFKESNLFVPIFFSIFQKTYLKDRDFGLKCKMENRPLPKLIYSIEEAKNYFRNTPIFKEMFEKVTLEARKYNVHLMFVVQNPDHIPYNILQNIDTRIFLLRPDKKIEVINSADKTFNLPGNVKEALNGTEQYELCVWYSAGVFNMKFEIPKYEMDIFSTNPNEASDNDKDRQEELVNEEN